jgi:hypothetical protein
MTKAASKSSSIVLALMAALAVPLALMTVKWGLLYVLTGLRQLWLVGLTLALGAAILIGVLLWHIRFRDRSLTDRSLWLAVSAVVISGVAEVVLYMGLAGCC